MNSVPSRWIDFDASLLDGLGIYRFGIATLTDVAPASVDAYNRWLSSGSHGAMDYLERYGELRANPRLLLEGSQSIVCCAFPYYYPVSRSQGALKIARYALGRDYHDVVRQRLESAASRIRAAYGGQTRVCVDTAPLRERYWAVESGLGFIGLNNQLIIPGGGSYFFLGEILTTTPLSPTTHDGPAQCHRCGRCIRACPVGALKPDGSCDASRCLSYLTIEYRGEFPPETDLHGAFYGCDCCAEVCPYNANPAVSTIEEFRPNPALLSLNAEQILSMSHEQYTTLFRGSPMKRAKLQGLQRNARQLKR